ncbi:MAG: hypothetical protein KBS86_02485 [Proteobacteria bacterium]|nr:hypothetical protein [Candidatus Enterousia scatequi]
MLLSKLKSVFGFAVTACFVVAGANAAFLSDYGQIQNVPDYSLNPANKIGTPYNQTFPRMIYAQGTDLDTAECERTVATLIAAYCAGINNCVETRLSDLRPVIMVQLSRLPGHNYASACGGFIDSEFERFTSQYGNAAPQYRATFPNATEPTKNSDGEFKIKNPYEIKLNDWQIDYLERANELEQLQAINGAGTESLARADFPETFADLPFEERMAILQSGYEQYKDSSAYKQMNIEDYEDYQIRIKKESAIVKNFCLDVAPGRLRVLNADLAMAKQCRDAGVPVGSCNLQGTY